MGKYDSDEFSDFFSTDSGLKSQNKKSDNFDLNNNNYNGNNELFFDEISIPQENMDFRESTYAKNFQQNDYREYDTEQSYGKGKAYGDEAKDYEDESIDYEDSEYYDKDTSSSNQDMNSPEAIKMRKKLRKSKKLGTFLSFVQLIASIVFMVILFGARTSFSSLVTIPVYAGIGVVLFLLFIIALNLQAKRLLLKRLGKFISVIVIIICLLGSFLLKPLMGVDLGGSEKLSTKPFVIYLSADDHFGEMSEKNNGRSDTNILAVVNPKTYTALLLSTPRDAYVELIGEDIPEGSYDKLTHGGKYGTGVLDENGNWGHGYDVLMDILGNLYGVEVEHYLRLNFTGFIDLVDNMGGVTIDIPQGFDTYTYGKSYTFEEGLQTLDGEEALTYVRERHAFATGDMQRGKNQVAMIKALIDQALSANTIKNYSSIVESISKSFETDIDISSLATLQLQVQGEKDYDGWNIVSYSVDGSTGGGYQHCYTTDSYLSVVSLDEDSVEIAKTLVDMVMNGDEVNDDTAKNLAEQAE